MKIGVVSGLPRERACLKSSIEKPREFNAATGLGPVLAGRAASDFIDAGACALMSFGIAGGLSAVVPAGTVILATAVVDGETTHLADENWLSRIEKALVGKCDFMKGTLAGTDWLISSPMEKQKMHNLTGAVACDMESHAVARLAALNGVPFSIIRVVADPFDRVVPEWIIRCLNPSGGVQFGRLFLELVGRPLSLVELVGLSKDTKKAFNSLRRVALHLGPRLLF